VALSQYGCGLVNKDSGSPHLRLVRGVPCVDTFASRTTAGPNLGKVLGQIKRAMKGQA
jgi:hypothetical protein